MNIVLWIITGLLAAAFLGAGFLKLTRPREKLREAGMGWTDDFSPGAIKGIGLAEVLGALGLILPAVTGIATILVPLAATGLLITMIGAVITHVRRHESFVPPLVLGVLALIVAVGRFGPWSL